MNIAEKLTTIAENMQGVKDAGYEKMREDLTNALTVNGTRTNYLYCFYGSNYSGFKFTQTIKPIGVFNHMFYNSLEMTELPTPLDFSEILANANDAYANRRSIFAQCRKLEVIPDLNMRAIGGIDEWFNYCLKLHTIELLRVHEGTIYNNTFNNCNSLQNITFSEDSVIGQNIDFHWSPLSKESIENIIGHLSKTLSEKKTLSLKQSAVEVAFSDDEWIELITPISNQDNGKWTISLS